MDFRSYLHHNGKKYDEIQDDIEKRRDAFINMMDNLADNSPDEDVPYISNKEFQNYKNSMMLTALFEKFFTPINDELLINDMTQGLSFHYLEYAI